MPASRPATATPMLLRVGLVSGEYPPMEGGVGAFTRVLGRTLAALGHQVHIFTSARARPPAEPGQRQAPSEPVELGYAWLHPRAHHWRWGDIGLLADLALRYELQVINLQYQAAAYNMRHPAINLAPFRLRGLAAVVTTFHDLRLPYLLPKAGWLRRAALRAMARHSHGVIATNQADYAALSRMATTPLVQIPIGSNIPPRQPSPAEVEELRRGLGLPPDAFLLGYFGFLHPGKGADLLVQALATCPPGTHLLFIGGQTGDSDAGTNRRFQQALEGQIAALEVAGRVHWSGFLPEEQVSTCLCAADLMVAPYRDGASLRRGTLMAILAHGRPLLTTRPQAATPELEHGGNCWLVPANDAEALGQAIGHLAAAPELRTRLGQAAASLAGRFSWEVIAARTAGFYAQVFQQFHAPGS